MRGEGVLWLPRRVVVEHPLFRWERRLDRPWTQRVASPFVHNIAAGLILTALTLLWWIAAPLHLRPVAFMLSLLAPLMVHLAMRRHTARRFRQMRDQGLLRELVCVPLPLSRAFAAMIRAHGGPARVTLLLPPAVCLLLEISPWRLALHWQLTTLAVVLVVALQWRTAGGDCGVAISDVEWLILPPSALESVLRHFTLVCVVAALATVPITMGLLFAWPFWVIVLIGLIGGPIIRGREGRIRGRAELEEALRRYACEVGDDRLE